MEEVAVLISQVISADSDHLRVVAGYGHEVVGGVERLNALTKKEEIERTAREVCDKIIATVGFFRVGLKMTNPVERLDHLRGLLAQIEKEKESAREPPEAEELDAVPDAITDPPPGTINVWTDSIPNLRADQKADQEHEKHIAEMERRAGDRY